ncbi:hypothetical protein [Ruegeria sp.]|uniref:hypothetical protein n=1 Tax=Ruegeria sp. TaxID=1879320 RepID=UPI003B00322F
MSKPEGGHTLAGIGRTLKRLGRESLRQHRFLMAMVILNVLLTALLFHQIAPLGDALDAEDAARRASIKRFEEARAKRKPGRNIIGSFGREEPILSQTPSNHDPERAHE